MDYPDLTVYNQVTSRFSKFYFLRISVNSLDEYNKSLSSVGIPQSHITFTSSKIGLDSGAILGFCDISAFTEQRTSVISDPNRTRLEPLLNGFTPTSI